MPGDEVLIETGPERYRAVLVRDGRTFDRLTLPRHAAGAVGDICRGRVVRRMRNLEAAFIDIGLDRPAFLEGARAPAEGAPVTVQVVEAASDKAARVATRIALAGRFVVLLPGDAGVAVSRRLDKEARVRLNAFARAEARPGEGVIVRAAAALATSDEIATDWAALRRSWDRIEAGRDATPPIWLHREDPIRRILCAFGATPDARFVVDDEATLHAARDFAKAMSGTLAARIERAREPVLDRYGVGDDLAAAEQAEIGLPSGGRLIIEPTAALTAIDVDTAAMTAPGAGGLANLEAAAEIGRQLRLRELGGTVVVDFIRMSRRDERERVLAALRQAVAPDRRRVDILGWTKGGLVELSRARSDIF